MGSVRGVRGQNERAPETAERSLVLPEGAVQRPACQPGFREAGLAPALDGGYLQRFDAPFRSTLRPGGNALAIGGAKLARGLQDVLAPGELAVVGNVGDDLEALGLHVSPDLDIVTYTLAGRVDDARGYGLAGDSFHNVLDGVLVAAAFMTDPRLGIVTALYQRMGRLAGGNPLPFVGSTAFYAGRNDSTIVLLGLSLENRTLSFQRKDRDFLARYRVEVGIQRQGALLGGEHDRAIRWRGHSSALRRARRGSRGCGCW